MRRFCLLFSCALIALSATCKKEEFMEDYPKPNTPTLEDPIKVGLKVSADHGFFYDNPIDFESVYDPNSNLFFIGFYNQTLNQTNSTIQLKKNGYTIIFILSYFGKPYAGLKTTIEEASLSINRFRISSANGPMDLTISIPKNTHIHISKYGKSYETIKGSFSCNAHHFDHALGNHTDHYANIMVEFSVVRFD